MATFDLPLAELWSYRCAEAAPSDFEAAWLRTLAEARSVPMTPTLEPVASGLKLVETYDVTFPGFGGDPIKAWLTRPAGSDERLPVVVCYQGYGGGRGLPLENLVWPAAGYAQLFMDTRGQGSTWSGGGHTADPHGSGPAAPGYLTRGVESFETLYYRRLITDAVRAVDAARALPGIDADRMVVSGGSQGGGLALAASGLVDGLAGVLADVPFLCDFRRAVEVSDADPYLEIQRFLKVHRDRVEAVFATLAYVDGVHHGARASAPALFSVALADHICPPSTVFAAYHSYAGPKNLEIYPYNDHEGGQSHHQARQLAWLADLLS